mmetsp:Transcript_27435/g.41064  ORF Transcript_27435/g.41064 Transcript_27435/m.41064 type:complete len:84 (-) Transcript_27435:175-426(-)
MDRVPATWLSLVAHKLAERLTVLKPDATHCCSVGMPRIVALRKSGFMRPCIPGGVKRSTSCPTAGRCTACKDEVSSGNRPGSP